MWIWPMAKFWQYTPLQYMCVLLWNFSEVFKIRLPYAPVIFNVIMGDPNKIKRMR